MKFFADENIAADTIEFLKKRGLDVTDVYQAGLRGARDDEIVRFAAGENRMILTHDLDFAEMYYFRKEPAFGVVVLRIEPQIPADVNEVLRQFLDDVGDEIDSYADSLVIVERKRYRVRRR